MNTTTVLTAPDIVCEGCAAAIKNALQRIPGVQQVDVDIAAKSVTVKHDKNLAREEIARALDDAGFPVA